MDIKNALIVREPAWHSVGTRVDRAPSLSEAIKMAGLDWQVLERPLYMGLPNDKAIELETHKGLIRSDNYKQLGVVGINYEPVQNIEAFSYFDDLVSNGIVELDTALSLKEGKVIVVTAKIKQAESEVVRGDNVEGYLVFTNSHDGSSSVKTLLTPIRVVCMNTLAHAVVKASKEENKILNFRHTASVLERIDEAKQIIDFQTQTFRNTVEQYQAMSRVQMVEANFNDYVSQVFAPELGKNKQVQELRAYPTLLQNFHYGIGTDLNGVNGTLWGAYQAVTQYTSHQIRAKGQETTQQIHNRLNSLWLGNAKKINERAHQVAVKMTVS